MLKLEGLRGLSLVDVMEMDVEKTYVVFCNTNEFRWYNKYLRKGFQHCFIVYYNGVCWYKMEHNYIGSDFRPLVMLDGFVFNQSQNISRYWKNLKDVEIIEVDRNQQELLTSGKQRSKFILVPNTCVEFVKDWVGIRDYWLLTPYQLFKYLKRKIGAT